MQIAFFDTWTDSVLPKYGSEQKEPEKVRQRIAVAIVRATSLTSVLALLYVFFILGAVVYDELGGSHLWIRLLVVVLFSLAILYMIITSLVYVTIGNRPCGAQHKWLKRWTYENAFFRYCVAKPVMCIALYLLGVTEEPTIQSLHETEEKWNGRLNHTELHVKRDVKDSEDRLGRTISGLQDRIVDLEEKLAERDERHQEALQAILESIQSSQQQAHGNNNNSERRSSRGMQSLQSISDLSPGGDGDDL